MLIGISKLIPPELIRVLVEIGHGDEMVLADGNFPAASHAQRFIRYDGRSPIVPAGRTHADAADARQSK